MATAGLLSYMYVGDEHPDTGSEERVQKREISKNVNNVVDTSPSKKNTVQHTARYPLILSPWRSKTANLRQRPCSHLLMQFVGPIPTRRPVDAPGCCSAALQNVGPNLTRHRVPSFSTLPHEGQTTQRGVASVAGYNYHYGFPIMGRVFPDAGQTCNYRL